jgi:hypothetical protein
MVDVDETHRAIEAMSHLAALEDGEPAPPGVDASIDHG